MKQFLVAPAGGKRIIACAVAQMDSVKYAIANGTVVIIAGTTNAFVALEILEAIAQADGFVCKGFRRGMVTPPGFDASKAAAEFPGDVVIVKGKWQKGKQIFDVADSLVEGDVIIKGANAVNVPQRWAGVYIADKNSGTIGASLPLIAGRRVKLLVPVGLEKRVYENIGDIADYLNAPGSTGPRMMPMCGEIVTELDAIPQLTGASARLVAAGGVYGAEGSVWIAVDGTPGQIELAEKLIEKCQAEPLGEF